MIYSQNVLKRFQFWLFNCPKLSRLFSYDIIQTLVVLGNVVDVAVIADGFEVAMGTLYLAFIGISSVMVSSTFSNPLMLAYNVSSLVIYK